eukprot:1349980-Prymnesium_polylepis.1
MGRAAAKCAEPWISLAAAKVAFLAEGTQRWPRRQPSPARGLSAWAVATPAAAAASLSKEAAAVAAAR